MSIYTGKFITEQESFKFIYPCASVKEGGTDNKIASIIN